MSKSPKFFKSFSYFPNGQDQRPGQFSGCCGSKFVTNPLEFTKTYRGIKVAMGKVVKPSENEKSNYYVIDTKNGPLSIAIRHKW